MVREESLGPRQLPIGELTDGDFQQICHRLIRLEYPNVTSTNNPDGGADTLLPRADGGWERAWQAKRYTGTIHWSKCKESLDRAVSNYEIEHMTFCFARNLTVNQQKKFQSDLVGRHRGVLVDFWDKDELLARLDGSDEGERVARHYFGDPLHDNERMVRAFRAAGMLETAGDVLERSLPLGEFLGKRDPFFKYPSHQFEEDTEVPLTPGAIMALGATGNGISARIDAVPRDQDAMAKYAPRIRMEFDPDETGQQAAEAVAEAIREHKAVTVDAGVQITAQRLPPLFEDMVGEPTRGKITLTPQGPGPWDAVCHAVTDRGDENIRLTLDPVAPAPAGWDGAFSGGRGGLRITISFRWVEGRGGQISVNWNYGYDNSPAHEQAAALKFLLALHGAGKLTISDASGGRPDLVYPLERQVFPVQGLLDLAEKIIAIEEWIGQSIRLPDEISAEQAGWIATLASAVRTRKLPAHWESATLLVDEEGRDQLGPRSAVRIEQDMSVNIFDREVEFAHGVLQVIEVEVNDLGPSDEDPSLHEVELRPVGGQPAAVQWDLLPPPRPTGTAMSE
jgi:hypothetical protein